MQQYELIGLDDSTEIIGYNPERQAGFLMRLVQLWILPLLIKGYKTPIGDDDLYESLDQYKSESVSRKLRRYWEMERLRGDPSLFRALVRSLKIDMLHSFVPRLCRVAVIFISPFSLKFIIEYLKVDSEITKQTAILFCFLVFVASVIDIVSLTYYWWVSQRSAILMKVSLIEIIYNKGLKISTKLASNPSSGEIINLISNDLNKLQDVVFYAHFIWAFPTMVSICAILSSYRIGILPTLSGLSVILILGPISFFLSKRMQIVRKKIMEKTGERVKRTNELLSFIKLIKLYTLESIFSSKVTQLRDEEVRYRKYFSFYDVLLSVINFCAIPVMLVASFSVFTLQGGEMTVEIAFSVLALFNVLDGSFRSVNMTLASFVQAQVAIKRVESFLLLDEVTVIDRTEGFEGIEIVNGKFGWNEGDSTLKDINFKANKGGLVCVIGHVGVGKSTLLNSIIGEVPHMSGSILYDGTIAYVRQEPFLLNDTIRKNILFDKKYDESRYFEVVKKCALSNDFDSLLKADQTLIGEKGINLSGGQKSRISLARALYSNADIYLFDDPLSAVDPHVSKTLFHECILKYLSEKTVILVTHQLQYLPMADLILIMEEGRIESQGTYQELIQQGVDLDQLLSSFNLNKSEEYVAVEQDSNMSHQDSEEEQNSEERDTGNIKSNVILAYLRIFPFLGGLTLLLYIVSQASSVVKDFYLSVWAKDGTNPFTHLFYFALLTLVNALFMGISKASLIVFSLNTAIKMHMNLLSTIISCPMNFFDTTPQGRIIARFSNDLENLDNDLPKSLGEFLNALVNFLSVILMMLFFTSFWNILLLAPCLTIYWLVRKFYVASSRELSRLKSIVNSPLFSHVEESINGSDIIRSSRSEEKFISKLRSLSDSFFQKNYLAATAGSFISNVNGLNTNIIIFSAVLIAVLTKGSVDYYLASLSLTYTITSSKFFAWFVSTSAEVENRINAVERFHQYLILDGEDIYGESEISEITLENEPSVEFISIDLRYRDDLPLVLKDLSFQIQRNEKIGIVGRTGAGKSSLVTALYRLVEIEGGTILINGVDISTQSVYDVRSKLCIIPQDPVLFNGTLRFNLDPYEKATDQEIWNVLKLIHFDEYSSSLPEGLYTDITQDGSMSVGQKQLLCIGRALLKKPSILFMDEATAGIDPETDALIQKTIRQEFKDCTVLTIAHRLNTILDSDRIMVMSNGSIIEFDTPANLITQGGAFSEMMH